MPGSKAIGRSRSCKRFSSIRRKNQAIHRYSIETQRKNFVKIGKEFLVIRARKSTKPMRKTLKQETCLNPYQAWI